MATRCWIIFKNSTSCKTKSNNGNKYKSDILFKYKSPISKLFICHCLCTSGLGKAEIASTKALLQSNDMRNLLVQRSGLLLLEVHSPLRRFSNQLAVVRGPRSS